MSEPLDRQVRLHAVNTTLSGQHTDQHGRSTPAVGRPCVVFLWGARFSTPPNLCSGGPPRAPDLEVSQRWHLSGILGTVRVAEVA